MQVNDNLDETLPKDQEELDEFDEFEEEDRSPEEVLAESEQIIAGLEAFLADVENGAEATEEEIAMARTFLSEILPLRQNYLDATENEQRAIEAERVALENAQRAEENLRQSLESLTDQELRALMRDAQREYGINSPKYQELVNAIRRFTPERLALALDT